MIAFLVSPLGRWAVVAAVLAALSGWAWLERAGRQAATVVLASEHAASQR